MIAFANVLLVIAALATFGLACCLARGASGNAHDRMGVALLCGFAQAPRWLCLTGAMLICVGRGVATWPEDRSAQYTLVLIAQAILGAGCLLCVIVSLEDLRNPQWMSRCLLAAPFAVPALEIFLVAWLLNPAAREGIDPRVATMIARVAAGALAAIVVGFAAVGLGAYAYDQAERARRHRESIAADEAATAARAADDDGRFKALTVDDPLDAWMPYAASQADDPRIAAAVAAIARRPNLVAELDRALNAADLNAESAALIVVERLPPRAGATLVPIVRAYGARVLAEVIAAADDANADARRDRLAYADARATAFIAAARGLRRAGVDLRAEVTAIVDAARPVDCDGARNIVRIYDHFLPEFADGVAR